MSKYPYLENLTGGDTDHPLYFWIHSPYPAFYTDVCRILDKAIKEFSSFKGFDKLIQNIRMNKGRFWSYLNELYIATGIYPKIIEQGKRIIFNKQLMTGREVDLIIESDLGFTAVEITAMLNQKNLNLLLPELFMIANENGQQIDVSYESEIPELSSYKTLLDIRHNFEKVFRNSNEFSYLNGKITIRKTNRKESSASERSTFVSKTEHGMVDEITTIMEREAVQVRGIDKKSALFIQMNHYDGIADHYFWCFDKQFGGYDAAARQLLLNMPEVFRNVIFWWTSINKVEPHWLYIADKDKMEVRQTSLSEVASTL